MSRSVACTILRADCPSMQYHVSVIRLLQPFVDRDSSYERVRNYRDRARSITRSTIKELRRLLALHEVRHGWNNVIPYVLHPIMVTSFGSLEDIALGSPSPFSIETSEPYQGLVTCLRALVTLSSFVFYAQPLFRLLTQTCQNMGIELPYEATNALDQYQSEEWTKNAAALLSSQYIADMRKTATDIENARMDAIVSRWNALALSSDDDKASSTVEQGAPEKG